MKLAFFLVLASPLAAADILVPGDEPSLLFAIAAAQPGDVIRVQTAATQQAVTIDKPLTILGDPICSIAKSCSGHAIELAGPGTGTVVLSGVRATSLLDCHPAPSAIVGGGFEALHIYDSELAASTAGLSGTGSGGHGISTTVPFLLLERTTVVGSGNSADDCTFPAFFTGTYAGVHAPGSTVVVLDSDVRGGAVSLLCCNFCTCPGFPPGTLGDGGPGIIAGEVHLSNSVVLGGVGAEFTAYPTGMPVNGVLCGVYANGAAFETTSSPDIYPGVLSGSGPLRIGSTWDVSYWVPLGGATPGFLYASLGVKSTPLAFGLGLLDSATLFLVGPIVALPSPSTLSIAIPNAPAFIGLEAGLQIVLQGGSLSGPAVGVFVP